MSCKEGNMSAILQREYSEQFDKERKHRVEVSYYKYGPARQNFGGGGEWML